MDKIVLGRTGIESSVLSLGTVELGLNYGIEKSKPTREESITILNKAIDSGINLFDTASSYGDSETILGEVLRNHDDLVIATKFNVPTNSNGNYKSGKELYKEIFFSIENSLINLQTPCLDILQIHNATSELIKGGEVLGVLKEAQKLGLIKFIGASVYGEDNARAIVNDGNIDVIQVAFNILDQRMKEIINTAKKADIGVVVRSVFLKGALTKHIESLPNHLSDLKQHVIKLKEDCATDDWDNLTNLALRFVLSSGTQSSVLVGVSKIEELDFALKCSRQKLLDNSTYKKLSAYSLSNDQLLNPAKWDI